MSLPSPIKPDASLSLSSTSLSSTSLSSTSLSSNSSSLTSLSSTSSSLTSLSLTSLSSQQIAHFELIRSNKINTIRSYFNKCVGKLVTKVRVAEQVRVPKELFNKYIMNQLRYAYNENDPIVRNVRDCSVIKLELDNYVLYKILKINKTWNEKGKEKIEQLISKYQYHLKLFLNTSHEHINMEIYENCNNLMIDFEKSIKQIKQCNKKRKFKSLENSNVEKNNKDNNINNNLDDPTLIELFSNYTKKVQNTISPYISKIISEFISEFISFTTEKLNELSEYIISELNKYSDNNECPIKVNIIPNEYVSLSYFNFDKIYCSEEIYYNLKVTHSKYSNSDYFIYDIYSMLRRYYTCLSDDIGSYEGTGFHGSIPPLAMKYLNSILGANCELFASPFNNYHEAYCSAFIDVDKPFGSLGSFFDITHKSGSYICNPPFTETFIDAMFIRLIEFLKLDEPFSFFVIIPNWTNPMSNYINQFKDSNFCVASITLGIGHHYVSGNSYIRKELYEAVHESVIFILQNDQGKVKWKYIEEYKKIIINLFNNNNNQ